MGTDGKCDSCKSTNGRWENSREMYWWCNDCGKGTQYFKISELGKEVLMVLLDGKDKNNSNI